MTNEELEEKFIKRTKEHIARVNKYAKKLGKSYPDHDASKLTTLLDVYKYFSKPREELTKEEDEALNLATLIHIKTTPHHPEYWTNTDLSGFTRINFTPNGIIDATQMPEEYLLEMVTDWCAMSEEFNNSPYDWFNKVNNVRWLFTPEQQKFILEAIHRCWDE